MSCTVSCRHTVVQYTAKHESHQQNFPFLYTDNNMTNMIIMSFYLLWIHHGCEVKLVSENRYVIKVISTLTMHGKGPKIPELLKLPVITKKDYIWSLKYPQVVLKFSDSLHQCTQRRIVLVLCTVMSISFHPQLKQIILTHQNVYVVLHIVNQENLYIFSFIESHGDVWFVVKDTALLLHNRDIATS